MSHVNPLVSRQYVGDTYDSWWGYSETAYIIKWVVVSLIFFFFIGFVLGGYLHAQRRMKKGLPPLRYHRWLVSRQQREQFFPSTQRAHIVYRPGGTSYQMQPYGPPPPAYHEQDYVPAYTPPQGTSKINPDQTYVAPVGPPPGHELAGSSYLGAAGPTQPLRAASPHR